MNPKIKSEIIKRDSINNITPLKEIQRNMDSDNLQEMIETKENQSGQKDAQNLNSFNLNLRLRPI